MLTPLANLAIQQVCNYLNISSSLTLEYALQAEFGPKVFELLNIYHHQEFDPPTDDLPTSGSGQYRAIGLSGKIGAGKSTIRDILVQQRGFVSLSFGTALKKVVSYLFQVDYDIVSGVRRAEREAVLPIHSGILGQSVSARTLLQRFGTQVIREGVNRYTWVYKIRDQVLSLYREGISSIVIDDARFPNERQLLRELGFRLWLVQRPADDLGLSQLSLQHQSENSLEDYYDLLIHNDRTIEHLSSAVLAMV